MKLAARWLHRRWGIVLLGALFLPVVAWYGRREEWWAIDLGPVFAVAAIIWLVGWFVSFIEYQRKVFRIQYEIDRRHRDYLNAIRRAENDALETVRLASLYDQYLDWAEIIAWMVHHPEGRLDASDHPALPPPIGSPLAMRVAEGIPSEETLQRTSAIVGRDVFSRGWLGNLYRSYSHSAIASLKHNLGLPDEAPDPDPDRDLSQPSPRAHVRDQVASGGLASGWHERVRQQVDTALAALPPDELFQEVQALHEHGRMEGDATTFLSDPLPQEGRPTALLQSVWRAEALFARPYDVDQATLWAPSQLLSGSRDGFVHRDAALADEAVAGAFVLAVVRCDASQGTTVEDLEIFRLARYEPKDDRVPKGPGIG
jgi:hypothetical protein